MGAERDMSPEAAKGRRAAYPAYPDSPRQAAGRPPLTKRMRRSHWMVIDFVAGAFLALFCTAVASSAHRQMGAATVPLLVVFLVAVFLSVGLRRRAPVIAFGVLLVLGVLFAGWSDTATAASYLAAAFVLYTVTVESRKRTGVAALGLIIAVTAFLVGAGVHTQRQQPARLPGPVIAESAQPPQQPQPGLLVTIGLANVIAWMTGYSVRQRRLYVVQLQHQAANSAVAEERLRIARELHDVVAHSMSVIAVQAGYGQYVIDASPGGAKDALGAIQATSRDALEEMRRMLGVLRQQDAAQAAQGQLQGQGPSSLGTAPGGPALGDAAADGATPATPVPAPQAPLAPAPGLASLDRLVERTRGAGLQVALEVTGHARPAPAGVDLAAYRIIQEALTNVVKHAGTAARCVVAVTYTDADLVIRVTDNGGATAQLRGVSATAPALPGTPAPSAAQASALALARASGAVPVGDGQPIAGGGHGIIGMRERVHLCGGEFSALPVPEGGFRVMAALPLPAVDSPVSQLRAGLGDFPPFDGTQLSGIRR